MTSNARLRVDGFLSRRMMSCSSIFAIGRLDGGVSFYVGLTLFVCYGLMEVLFVFANIALVECLLGENNKWKTRGGENNKWKTRASCSMSSTCVVLFGRVASLHGMVFAPRSCLCCPLGLHDEFACLVANADDDALAVEM